MPSHLYSFSFAPNPGWSETYSAQPEIRDYLRRVADDYGVRSHVRLNCAVTGIEWDDGTGGWTVETSDGPLRARVVVAGMGPLAEPKTPPREGLDTFEGETFHSARWNHAYDLKGKRVAVVGTGASAIQFVPEIQKDVERLHVIQRTAPWIMPHPNRSIRRWEARLYERFPPLQKLVRGTAYSLRELLVLGFVKNPRLMSCPSGSRAATCAARSPTRRCSRRSRRATRSAASGSCRRTTWYPALGEPNVEVITRGVREVTRTSVVIDSEGRDRRRHRLRHGLSITDLSARADLAVAAGATSSISGPKAPRPTRAPPSPAFPTCSS